MPIENPDSAPIYLRTVERNLEVDQHRWRARMAAFGQSHEPSVRPDPTDAIFLREVLAKMVANWGRDATREFIAYTQTDWSSNGCGRYRTDGSPVASSSTRGRIFRKRQELRQWFPEEDL